MVASSASTLEAVGERQCPHETGPTKAEHGSGIGIRPEGDSIHGVHNS